jgi:hypothetical protein
MAFFGTRADAEKLRKMAESDVDFTNRALATLGVKRLQPGAHETRESKNDP